MSEILVIEDDSEFNEILCKTLSKKGHDVVSASNAREAINLFKHHDSDLVITDVVLPDRDGIHVILDLQKIHPGIKIIAMSAGGCCASGREYLSDVQLLCNVKYTLTKPFKKDELLKLIQEALQH